MKIRKFSIIFLLLATALINSSAYSQKKTDPVKIDKNGRMLWSNTNQDAFFWGVNYSVPFAYGYRAMGRLGEDIEKNIDIDTYHLARMGVNAYRIHVWASQISDTLGNLVNNEHLKLLDYLINRLEQRGIYVFLTPIRYGGPGYPESDIKTTGFADKYPKDEMYLIPEAIAAQERYLKQFVSHVNPYSGKAYKDDPMIMGFEICNEPAHSKPTETKAFVKKMIGAVKSTGCKKPVFYNVTQNISLLEDFIKGGTDGVTFQWYPSGLVANHEQRGNFLQHVDRYAMPFQNEKYFLSQARLVYEFDAADVGRSYLYPAFALSFKEAGMQWGTMFAYDPMALAPSNTEYQTHFLNLAYTPQKSIGFKIAGELFRNPKYKRDRANEQKPFDIQGLKISYENDRSELATDELFYYTNKTSTNPPNLASLKSVAGYQSSPIVSYKGYGAYFLNKINDSIWRLEVMPDAIWVRDPFSKASPQIENVVIKWISHKMGVNLPDLGENFHITGINEGNTYSMIAQNGKFKIAPGAYILSTKPVSDTIKQTKIGEITAKEFYAPKETNEKFYFLLHSPKQVTEGQPFDISVTLVSPTSPIKNLVIEPFKLGFRDRLIIGPRIVMERMDEYRYKATVPDSLVVAGIFNYHIISESENGEMTVYPSGFKGSTLSWKYTNPEWYSTRIIPSKSEVQLFNPEKLNQSVIFTNGPNYDYHVVPAGIDGESSLKFSKGNVYKPENRPDTSGMICVIQNYIGDVIQGISQNAGNYSQLQVYGKALDSPVKIEVTLINKDGNAYSAETTLTTLPDVQTINLEDLTNSKMFLLPLPYPVFQRYWYSNPFKKAFKLEDIERIQLDVPQAENDEHPVFEIRSIILK